LSLSGFLLSALLASRAQAAIFGADDRAPVRPFTEMHPIAQATAISVLSSNIEADGLDTYKLDAPLLKGGLCRDQKFLDKPSLSYSCTGFLVGPDLLATAGHCMVNTGEAREETGMHCEIYGWLFDYQEQGSQKTKVSGIPAHRYYRCKRIVYAVKDEKFPFRDYALVQLDRPVTGRKPLALASTEPEAGDALKMVGYPLGMPVMATGNGKVLAKAPGTQSFVSDLDSMDGNSGAVVLSAKNEVVGILVGGTPGSMLVRDSLKDCSRVNKCDQEGKACLANDKDFRLILPYPDLGRYGSEVQKIAPIVELLKSLR
jgi:V8-like Glu-specific endopeptidase